jgi:hypothetical protein
MINYQHATTQQKKTKLGGTVYCANLIRGVPDLLAPFASIFDPT